MNLNSFSSGHLAIFSTALIISGLGIGIGINPTGNNAQNSGLQWDNTITIEKNGEQIDQFHNNLTDQGKKYIAGELFGVGTGNAENTTNDFEFISVGNATNGSIVSGTTQLPHERTNANLSRAAATTKEYDSGTYTLEKTFTANLSSDFNSNTISGPITVNATGLNYESGDTATLVSGGIFDDAELNGGDKLTVTHDITISDGG